MSEQELNALIAILNRAPLTPAEALWLRDLLARLQARQQEQAGIKAAAQTPKVA